MGKSFEDLRVWRKAMDMTGEVYKLTETFPRSELYGLASQMQRAAVSIPSNIAEGCARATRKDFRQFVLIAKGSNYELQTQLHLAVRLGIGEAEKAKGVLLLAVEVAKMLNGLSDFLATRSQTEASPPTRH